MNKVNMFLAFITIFIVLVTLFQGISVTGEASSQDSIYRFMLGVDNRPDIHIMILGRFATEVEINFARSFQSRFDVIVVNEGDINKKSNMILVGTPSTNLLLDKLLREKYFEDEAMISISRNNLLIIFNNARQSRQLLGTLTNYDKQFNRLSPGTIIYGIHGPLLYILIGILILLPLMIFGIEKKRGEITADKLNYLKEYFQKYEKEGHTEEELKKWLSNYGYKEKLIDKACAVAKNA